MFEVIETKNYDTYHKYGIDWNTDYICISDEQIDDISTLIEKVKNAGYEPCGDCSMVKKDDNIILKTAMY